MKIKKIKPLFNQIVTTMNRYDEDQTINGSSIIDTSKKAGSVKEYQTVVAVGHMVKNIQEGDLVMINPKRYAKMKHQEGSLKDGVITDNPVIAYNIPTIEMNDVEYLLLMDSDITYVIEEYEEDAPSQIIMPDKSIII